MDSDEEFDEELWRYDYWLDIDYDSDGDEIRARRHNTKEAQSKKRKRALADKESPSKRRKVQARPKEKIAKLSSFDQLPPVLMMKEPIATRFDPTFVHLVDTSVLKPFGLIKDWRARFQNTPMFTPTGKEAKLAEVVDAEEEEEVTSKLFRKFGSNPSCRRRRCWGWSGYIGSRSA